MQRYERLWERLLTLLGTLGEVEPGEAGRLVLTIDEHRIELIITEPEWGDLVGIPYGSFNGAAAHLLNVLSGARMDEAPYVVYDTYRLLPSATPDSPERAEMEAEERAMRAHLDAHPGARVEVRAYPPDPDEST